MTDQYQDPNINPGIGVLSSGAVILSPATKLNFIGFQVQPALDGQVDVTPVATAPSVVTLTIADAGMTLAVGTIYFVDTAGGDVPLVLPSAAGGGEIHVKNSGGNVVTLTAQANDSIDDGMVYELVNVNDAVISISDNQTMWGIW